MKTLIATLLLTGLAAAKPTVLADQYSTLDTASVKAGDWNEFLSETSVTHPDGPTTTTRIFQLLACVKADDEFIWMEETTWDGGRPDYKQVTLTKVRRADGIAVAAWWGKQGGDGTELKLAEARGKRKLPDGSKATGTVTKEKTKKGDKEVEAQKLVMTFTGEKDGKEFKTVSTVWMVPEGRLRSRMQDVAAREHIWGEVKWETEPTGPMALVRSEIKGDTWTTVMTAVDEGSDAKPTLTVK
ncbi:MAG: hypothetical protein K8T20_01995 [Planctomycetes bacterium]|nr:hypothetical protein [Planctomycetota bacterium]